jgi:hypothetical protein
MKRTQSASGVLKTFFFFFQNEFILTTTSGNESQMRKASLNSMAQGNEGELKKNHTGEKTQNGCNCFLEAETSVRREGGRG